MTTIDPSADVVTLINVFTVAPADQQRLLAVLTEATTAVVAGLPGFISANFHRSLDGSRVTNYAQWRSRKDLEAMRAHPAAAAHLREAATIAIGVEPHLYEVTAVVAAGAAPASRLAGVSAS